MKTELKLQIDPAVIPKLRRHPLLRKHGASTSVARQFRSIYFDTPDLYFSQHNCTLLVREEKQGWIQAFKKTKHNAAGLYETEEWACPLNGPHPDFPSLIAALHKKNKLIRLLSKPELPDQLEPIFQTEVRRTVWQVHTEHGDQIELALNQGKIEAEIEKRNICEVVLALIAGNPVALFNVALDIQNKIPLRINNQSNGYKGSQDKGLHEALPSPVSKSKSVLFSANASLADVFEIVVGNCLQQIRANEAGVLSSDNPEHLHQMRVGLRRLRVALELFSKIAPTSPELHDDVEWAATELGLTRDWDVLASDTLSAISDTFPLNPQLEAVNAAANAIATQRRHQTAMLIESPRYAQLLLRLGSWSHSLRSEIRDGGKEEKKGRDIANLSPKKFAARVYLQHRRKLLRRGQALDEGGAPALHKLRIAAKKLRYSTDFLLSLHAGRKIRSFTGPLNELLSMLGECHDDYVADGLLRELVRLNPGIAEGANFMRGYVACKAELNARNVSSAWCRFAAEFAQKK